MDNSENTRQKVPDGLMAFYAEMIARRIYEDVKKKYDELHPEEHARIEQLKKELNFRP